MVTSARQKITNWWRSFLLIDVPDTEYLEALEQTKRAGMEAEKAMKRFCLDLEKVTLKVERNDDTH